MTEPAAPHLHRTAERLLAASPGRVAAQAPLEQWAVGATDTVAIEFDEGPRVVLAAFADWDAANDAANSFRSQGAGSADAYRVAATNGAVAMVGWTPAGGGDPQDAPGSWALNDVLSAFSGKE